MITVKNATLRVKRINGRNGPFCIADLSTDFGEFKVKESLLDQFDEGTYEATVWIDEIYMGQYVAYGKAADTILTNHLTKVFYAGLSDPTSIHYIDRILGEAEVDTRSHSAAERLDGGSDQFSTTRVPLAPAHVLRQMRPGDALLVHGTLPPAHVRTRPFYRSPHLARRSAMVTGERKSR